VKRRGREKKVRPSGGIGKCNAQTKGKEVWERGGVRRRERFGTSQQTGKEGEKEEKVQQKSTSD